MDVLEKQKTDGFKVELIKRTIRDAKQEIDRKNPHTADLYTTLGEEISEHEWTLKELKEYSLIIGALEYTTLLAYNRGKQK